MKGFALAICLFAMYFCGRAVAQSTNVTTTGLTTGQCVQANGASSITAFGCSGRTNVILIGTPTLLTNSECGSVLMAGSAGSYQVTMPPTLLLDCEFTFKPGVNGFYVSFPFPTYAQLTGYSGNVTQWTILIPSAFRTNFPSISLTYNGSYWEQSGFVSSIYQTTLQPQSAAQLAHGQVYFSWNNSSSQFQLCESSGPGGLIVDGTMRQVPSGCLTLGQAETASNMLNYFYAVHYTGDDPLVQGVTLDLAGKILITFQSNVNGNVNDQVAIACDSIGGAIQANGSDMGTVESADSIELFTPPSALGTYTSGGACHIVRLAATTTGHTTAANGIQVMSRGPPEEHYTLVGMCEIGSSNSVNDLSTYRGCASYYNRGLKTCANTFTSDQSTNSLTYMELNSGIECNFVTWGTGDPAGQSDLS